MSRQTELAKSEPRTLSQSDRKPTLSPACDVYENADELLVVADLPGITADALNVNLDKNELRISARRDTHPKDGKNLGVDNGDCDFSRHFAVPGGIDESKISAEPKDGVLWLHLPKSEALKPRQIPVRAG